MSQMSQHNNNKKAKRQKIWIENYEKCSCNASKTAKIVGINRRTFQRWMKDDEEFRNQIWELEEQLIDDVEQRVVLDCRQR